MSSGFAWLCLIPPLFIIVWAVVTKKTFSALIIGAALAYFLMYKGAFFSPFVDSLYTVLCDADTVWVILLTIFIGVFIELVTNSGGVDALTQYILKIATNRRRTLLSTFILGLCFFIGDVSNIGTVGAAMKKTADKNKVPREALAYVLDSTAAPVCIMVPVSSWGVFFAGIFMAEKSLDLTGSAMSNYLHVIPFMFYSMAAILVVFLFSAGFLPKLGAMKKAYERVDGGGHVYSDRSAALNSAETDEEIADVATWKILLFLIPLAILVVWAIRGMFMEGAMIAIAICAVMYIPLKVMSFGDYCKHCMSGFKNMISPIIIIVGAFMVRDALVAMGLPEYVSGAVESVLSPVIFPALAFVVVAILSFTTGSNWGVPAVMIPIIVPIAMSIGCNPFIILAAVACGGCFGSHACFYSDATVFTSAVCKIDNMDHALSQLPYCLLSAGIATVAFLVAGIVVI